MASFVPISSQIYAIVVVLYCKYLFYYQNRQKANSNGNKRTSPMYGQIELAVIYITIMSNYVPICGWV